MEETIANLDGAGRTYILPDVLRPRRWGLFIARAFQRRSLGTILAYSSKQDADGAALPPDPRLISPAAERNLAPILAALRELAPASGKVLEIASGPGQHIIAFAQAFPQLTWRPSDPDPAARASIAAYAADHALPNLLPPLPLDAAASAWGAAEREAPFDLILAINLAHIAPFAVTQGLFAGAARLLTAAGSLLLYGPFLSGDGVDAPSNLAFDTALRTQDPAWGVRTLAEVSHAAQAAGLALIANRPMPANNCTLAFARKAA